MTNHEESLVAGDHPLQHGDDRGAFLRPGRALDAELLVGVLLLVENVGTEDGGQVQRRHLVSCDLHVEKQTLQHGPVNVGCSWVTVCIFLQISEDLFLPFFKKRENKSAAEMTSVPAHISSPSSWLFFISHSNRHPLSILSSSFSHLSLPPVFCISCLTHSVFVTLSHGVR